MNDVDELVKEIEEAPIEEGHELKPHYQPPKPTECQWCDGASGSKPEYYIRGEVMAPRWICGGCVDLFLECDRCIENDQS